MKQRVLSGIQPSGELHLGNYLGAIQQWIDMQKKHESLFCIVDLHAITVRQDAEALRENVRRVAASYIACGVDPVKSAIFVQSHVHEHTELAWVLGTFTMMGELQRMTQYKDKLARKKEDNSGLFTYPVLMAADILLYQATIIPVGDDQKQHIELTRNIAERFNNHYKQDIFTLPEGMFPKTGARIMGLDDPTVKMSKGANSTMNYISFLDEPDVVRKKIMKAVTDSGDEIVASDDKPAVKNLLTIYSMLSGKSISALEKEYSGKGYGDFKTDLADVTVEWLAPIQERINELLQDPAELDSVLQSGKDRAQAIAAETLQKVYTAVGLL